MKNLLVMLLAFTLSATIVHAQKVLYSQAKALYDKGEYADAVAKFQQLYQKKPEQEDMLYYMSLSYWYLDKNEEAVRYLEELNKINADYWPYSYYVLAYACNDLGNFAKAQGNFQIFLDKYTDDADDKILRHKAAWKLHYATESPQLRAAPITNIGEPVNMGSIVNGISENYLPSSDPTGKRVYFTSTRKGGISAEDKNDADGDEDIYYVDKVDGEWQSPVLLPEPINSKKNDGAPSISADGQTMFMTLCYRDGGVGSCDIYVSYLEGNQWSEPQNLGNVVNSEKWDAQPSVSADGNRLFFVSERVGGYGGNDIYMTEKTIFGEWGVPQNLGSIINTPFSEVSPFISPDGKTLYFASTGHPGYGDSDIFRSIYQDGRWSVPVNLGRPINTANRDSYFTIGGSGEVGFMASTRENDLLNLYEVRIPESMRPQPTMIVKGKVSNFRSQAPLSAWILVEDLETKELIATSKSNSKTGEYLVVLPAGRNYSVSATNEGYFFYSNNFDLPADAKYQEIKRDIALKPIEKGTRVVLNNIFFETGKSALKPESYIELNKVVNLLQSNPGMQIEIGGHTDNVGSEATNLALSHARAKSVMDYLVMAGIKIGRLQAKGYGETQPVAANSTAAGRKQNRRVEFVVKEI
jgi:OmpA-OmpF porin, OOP family